MKIHDLYTPFAQAVRAADAGASATEVREQLKRHVPALQAWDYTERDLQQWLQDPESRKALAAGEAFAREEAARVVAKVEGIFETELPGDLFLLPSLGDFDGFARYDSGHHTVLLGIDFPDADLQYLQALAAHELSHVYRDHQPEVWAHLGKPIREVTRAMYLRAATAEEHLASEGLATLFSQLVYPEIPPHVHHYYETAEWEWCEQHHEHIHSSLMECLQRDRQVWSFYGSDRVARGSPGREQYYWAAQEIARQLGGNPTLAQVVEAHRWTARRFASFS